MPATQTAPTLADLTCPELLKPSYIESGRRKWEASSAGALIRMFAAAGYDVTTPEKFNDGDSHCRVVTDQSGVDVAFLLWCTSIPNYVYAMTPKVW